MEWRPVVGYEGFYEVSDLGDVRRVLGGQGARAGKILRPQKHPKGYLAVRLSTEGKPVRHTVHRLVALAFLGPAPEGTEVCHANDVKDDNRAVNLRWDTHSENHFDITRNGNRATHCKRGHEFTPENTYLTPSTGYRQCVSCIRYRASQRVY